MTLRQDYAKAAMKGLLVGMSWDFDEAQSRLPPLAFDIGMIREGDRYPART